MHFFLYVILAVGSCVAYYRDGYDIRNLIEREEPQEENKDEFVECPVCMGPNDSQWLPNNEKCPIVIGNKRYKKCTRGTYVNTVCDNRMDCYRGPGEQCTEKMEYDSYGKKCASGYYCHKYDGVCIGLGYNVESEKQWLLNPNRRYPLRARRSL